MTPPDPDGMSLLAKVAAAAAALLAPFIGFWKWLDIRFADRAYVERTFSVVHDEIAIHRGHIAKIFDQMRDMELKSEARHRELMMHLLDRKK